MRFKSILVAVTCLLAVNAYASSNTSKNASPKSQRVPRTQKASRPVAQSANAKATQAELRSLNHRITILERILNQNKGGVIQNDPAQAQEWWQRFVLSSRIDVDTGVGSRTPSTALPAAGGFGRYTNGGSSDISLTNALLYFDAWVNRYVTGHIALLYTDNRGVYQLYDQDNGLVIAPPVGTVSNPRFERNKFALDEAYVRIKDFDWLPLYFEAGRFYTPFGDYQLHPITMTLAQQLEQTQATALMLGYVLPIGDDAGFSAKVYGFRGAQKPTPSLNRNVNNFGAQAAFAQNEGFWGYKLGLGYMFNMNDVDVISTTPIGIVGVVGNFKRVGGVAFDGEGHVGPFDAYAHFVSAVTSFNAMDVPYRGKGAVPKAVVAGVGYNFLLFNLSNRIGADYQQSWQASGIGLGAVIPGAGLPRRRVEGDYAISVFTNTVLHLQVHYDKDYSIAAGGTNRDSVTGILRLSVGIA